MLASLRSALMVFGIVLLAGMLIAVGASLPDIKRYLRVRQM